MSTKLSRKKAAKRVKARADRHEAMLKNLPSEKVGGYKAPGSQNFKKTGKR